MLDKVLIRFLLVGFVNAFFGLGVIFICKWLLDFSDVYSNLIGYAIGLLVSFLLNKFYVFNFNNTSFGVLLRFIFVVLVAYSCNLVVVVVSIDIFGINNYMAQSVGVIPYTSLSYLGNRFFVFNHKG